MFSGEIASEGLFLYCYIRYLWFISVTRLLLSGFFPVPSDACQDNRRASRKQRLSPHLNLWHFIPGGHSDGCFEVGIELMVADALFFVSVGFFFPSSILLFFFELLMKNKEPKVPQKALRPVVAMLRGVTFTGMLRC